jgi:hypothetical protein
MPAPNQLMSQLPNVDAVLSRSANDIIFDALGPPSARGVSTASGLEAMGEEEAAPSEVDVALEDSAATSRAVIVAAGQRAVGRLQTEGPQAPLTPDEQFGLEAIVVLEGRPAIFIQEGKFFPPPPGWQQLEPARAAIEATIRSVGRVEVTGHPSYEWIGTGFVVAGDVIMTNRHVAELFCQMGARRKWMFKQGMAGRVDYKEELSSVTPSEFAITDVIGVHETLDMALFRVAHTGGQAPTPLKVASVNLGVAPGREVYTIGFPAWDGRRNDPEAMQRIFSNIFNIKRLQPGQVMSVQEANSRFMHDCSTLGGNSGSCVVDLATHQVIGLHFGGRYLEGNHAVALWTLTGDPLIKKAKINYA